MTPQVIVGLVLLLVGVAIKVFAAVKQLPDIAIIGELTNFGFLLLGKELMQPSAAATARRSTRPPVPPVALVWAVLLASCTNDASVIRDRANEYTRRVNHGQDILNMSGALIMAGCGYLDERSPCPSVRQAHEAARASIAVAHEAIAVYDATGKGPLETITRVIAAEADVAAFALELGKLRDVIRAEARKQAEKPQ